MKSNFHYWSLGDVLIVCLGTTEVPVRVDSIRSNKKKKKKAVTDRMHKNQNFLDRKTQESELPHNLCSNCNKNMEKDFKNPLPRRKVPQNSPKHDKILFLKRPLTKEKPSPYEPKRNFKVLKDFFQVQILDSNQPNYAMSRDGKYLYNTNM